MVQALKLKMKEQKGFTLIELLAVIVILGIIAAIAIPAIGNVINKSDNKAVAQEGVQIINAAKMFVANEPSTAVTFDASGKATIDQTNLEKYLDHVKAANFKVIVTKTASGKFTYELTGGHPAVKLVDSTATTSSTDTKTASEQELINKTNGN